MPSGRPGSRLKMLSWLEIQIDSKKYDGLRWVDRNNKIFKVPWKHASSQNWKMNDASIFKAWAVYTGRYRGHIDAKDDKKIRTLANTWKANFRCALNAQKGRVKIISDEASKNGNNAFRIYQIVSKEDSTEIEETDSDMTFGKRKEPRCSENVTQRKASNTTCSPTSNSLTLPISYDESDYLCSQNTKKGWLNVWNNDDSIIDESTQDITPSPMKPLGSLDLLNFSSYPTEQSKIEYTSQMQPASESLYPDLYQLPFGESYDLMEDLEIFASMAESLCSDSSLRNEGESYSSSSSPFSSVSDCYRKPSPGFFDVTSYDMKQRIMYPTNPSSVTSNNDSFEVNPGNFRMQDINNNSLNAQNMKQVMTYHINAASVSSNNASFEAVPSDFNVEDIRGNFINAISLNQGMIYPVNSLSVSPSNDSLQIVPTDINMEDINSNYIMKQGVVSPINLTSKSPSNSTFEMDSMDLNVKDIYSSYINLDTWDLNQVISSQLEDDNNTGFV